MIDVLLTHSYHLYYDHKQVRKMQPYPPLGTLYAAALLRQKGFSVALFDTMLEDPAEGFPAALDRHRPRMVAIYEDNFNFLSKMCLTRMRQVAFSMLDSAKAGGAFVVANGSDAADHTEEYLRRGFDCIMSGEAEWTLLDLARANLTKPDGDLREHRGIAYLHSQTGPVIRTTPRPFQRDLGALPVPARDLIDIECYRRAWKSAHQYFSLNLVASRGCPYRCDWCAKPIYGDSFQIRTPENVADEMQCLKEKFGAEQLWFADDIFALSPRWTSELSCAVERRNVQLPFKIQTRVNLISEETAGALRRAGCAEVWLGVESGSQKILDAMEKGTRVEQAVLAREILRRHGIRACFFLQFGYPGEEWEDIRQTIHLVRDTQPDDIGVSVSYPLPGTKFHDLVRQELGEKTNWTDSDDLSVMFRGIYTNEFYRALRDALHAEVDWGNQQRAPSDGSLSAGVREGRGWPPRLQDLWLEVEELEKTCRNAEPTLRERCSHTSLTQILEREVSGAAKRAPMPASLR